MKISQDAQATRMRTTGAALLSNAMVDAMGVVRLLGKQQPDKMITYKPRPITETAEQAKEAKGQKGKIAKQILLGIDAHLKSCQLCRKIDAGGLQPVQSFSLEKLLLFGYKQRQLAERVYAVYEAGPLGDHRPSTLQGWRHQSFELAGSAHGGRIAQN